MDLHIFLQHLRHPQVIHWCSRFYCTTSVHQSRAVDRDWAQRQWGCWMSFLTSHSCRPSSSCFRCRGHCFDSTWLLLFLCPFTECGNGHLWRDLVKQQPDGMNMHLVFWAKIFSFTINSLILHLDPAELCNHLANSVCVSSLSKDHWEDSVTVSWDGLTFALLYSQWT